jgi:hypothetical protein
MNDLMHVSLKQIQMLMTFVKYNLLLLYDNNHYIYVCVCVLLKRLIFYFSNVSKCFVISLRGKRRMSDSSSSSQACSGTSTDLFAVMVLLNFYLYVLIHFYFTTSFDIFYYCFCLQGTLASRHRQEAFLEALNDEGQQQMTRAAQQEAHEEPEVGGAQQPEFEEADDQP